MRSQCGYDSLGKTLMQISVIDGDETIINLQRAKVYVFSESWKESNESWKERIQRL